MAIKNINPLENFDWEEFENGGKAADKAADKAAYEGTLNNVNDNEVVDGTVTSINDREVVVNIGYKSDGIIPRSEFRYAPDLKVGDKVEVYIENQEDKKGQLVLSHKKARQSRSWDRVNAALENNEIVQGFVKCRTKGGMIVDVFGTEAFLPGSQIDVKPIRDYDTFVGKTMEFSSPSWRRARFWKVPSRTSRPTAYSSTWAVWTVSSTSPTSLGAASAIRRKSCSLTRSSTSLSSTSTTRRSASLWV